MPAVFVVGHAGVKQATKTPGYCMLQQSCLYRAALSQKSLCNTRIFRKKNPPIVKSQKIVATKYTLNKIAL